MPRKAAAQPHQPKLPRKKKPSVPADRDAAVVQYLPYVLRIARGIKQRLPSDVSLEDLVQEGAMGLIEALEKFDPAKGVAFKTYASYRIRGRMIDSLRDFDFLGRKPRTEVKQMHDTIDVLTNKLGRRPDDLELAEELGCSLEVLAERQARSHYAKHVSLSTKVYDGESRMTNLYGLVSDPNTPAPESRAEALDRMRRLVRGLSKGERLLVLLYYWEGWPMKQIGQTLGLSESRISQMLTQILTRLRARGKEALS